MKNHVMFIWGILLTTLFTSCVSDYEGSVPEEPQFTEKNYVYEGDLYRVYLENEIEQLDGLIQELEEIIANNQGDEETENNLEHAYQQQNFLAEEIENILSLEQLVKGIPDPPLPCPVPQNCDFSELKYLLIDSKIEFIEVVFINENNEIIGGGEIDEIIPLPETDELISVANLSLEGYQGDLSAIRVQLVDNEGVKKSYLVK